MKDIEEIFRKVTDYGGKIGIAGLGKTGSEAAKALRKGSYEIIVLDHKVDEGLITKAAELEESGITTCLSYDAEKRVKECAMLVLSPGIPPDSPFIKEAKAHDVRVISELDLAWHLLKQKPAITVGITGTNGKSTVTTMVGRLLKSKFENVFVGGNIGTPLIQAVDEIDENTAVVLELSSFQLYFSFNIRLDTGILLNITPDHFDWHRDFSDYTASKRKLLDLIKEDGWAVLNSEDPIISSFELPAKVHGCYFGINAPDKGELRVYLESHERITMYRSQAEVETIDIASFKLFGKHNLSNLSASVAAAWLAGVSKEEIEREISGFEPLPHRMEEIFRAGKIRFIDDSKATNSDASIKAIESFESNLICLIGGKGKESSYEELGKTIARKNAVAVLFGESAAKIEEDFKRTGVVYLRSQKFKDAVYKAIKLAALISRSGYEKFREMIKNGLNIDAFSEERNLFEDSDFEVVVLLSPACASFDEFSSYAERGDVFKETVGSYFSMQDKSEL